MLYIAWACLRNVNVAEQVGLCLACYTPKTQVFRRHGPYANARYNSDRNTCSFISDKPKTVAFMAQLSSNTIIEPLSYIHRPIVFDQVSVNVGNAYNKFTGVLTAPYRVSYYFYIDIFLPPKSGIIHHNHVNLFRNDQKIGYISLTTIHSTGYDARQVLLLF